MAKGRVTERSLRVGQTIWCIYLESLVFKVGSVFVEKRSDWGIINFHNKLHKRKPKTDFLSYSKKKAKTKMKKLNKDLKRLEATVERNTN